MKIYPSLISADLLNLEKVLKNLDDRCDGYHIDVMDDHFVPNLTWGPAFADAILKASNLPIHLHLMVDNPEKWVGRVNLKKDDTFVFHHEVYRDVLKIKDLIFKIKSSNCKVGVAINPETNVEEVFPYLPDLDHILIMSVKPGFSGQKFIPDVVKKVEPLIDKRKNEGFNFTVGIDGGIGASNIKIVAAAGFDEVGIASAIFSQPDYLKALADLYKKSEL